MHSTKNPASSPKQTAKTYRAKKLSIAKSYDDFLEAVAEEFENGFHSQFLRVATSVDFRMVR